MLNRPRLFLVIFFAFILVLALPLPAANALKSTVYSVLKTPLSASKVVAEGLSDLLHFSRNAQEVKALRAYAGQMRLEQVVNEEIRLENARLTGLLGVRKTLPPELKRMVFCRVAGKSSSLWGRVLLIDKGLREGIRQNMLVLSESSLVGKVFEAGPHLSRVILVSDPNSKIGVVLQRTREQGVLYGTIAGECRIKYIPLESDVKEGDIVETAGFGGFFPKGLLVGKIGKIWKEPGQSYRVARVEPFMDFRRVEEVACVE